MLIIKCDVMLRPEAFKDMAAEIARQCRGGSLVLPQYCRVVAEVPDGEEIKVVGHRLPEIGEPTTITLDRSQWQRVYSAMQRSMDENRTKAWQWEHVCADPQIAAEKSNEHRQNAAAAEAILAVIDAALAAPVLQEATYGGD